MKIVGSLVVFVLQAFTDDGIFMLLNAQVEMMAGVTLYNSNHTNYIEIHTQRIVGLQVRSLFP